MTKRIHLLILTAVTVSGCDRLPNDVLEAVQPRSFYEVTSEIDPITDARTLEAKATLHASNGLNTSTISWSCTQPVKAGAASSLKLSITSFEPPNLSGQMEGAAFDGDFKYLMGMSFTERVIRLRIDANDPYTATCTSSAKVRVSCPYSNQLSVDLNEEDIGLIQSADGFAGGNGHEIVYQYVVSGITYTYKAPINEDVAQVLNACPKPRKRAALNILPPEQPSKPSEPANQPTPSKPSLPSPRWAWQKEPEATAPRYVQAIWTFPSGDQMMQFYPSRARERRLDGIIEIDCILSAQGRITGCDIISESPAGYGFGEAAIGGFMKYATARPAEGKEIRDGDREKFSFKWSIVEKEI